MRELIGRYGWRYLEPSALMEGPGPLAERLKRRVGMIPSLILFWEGEDLVSALAPEIEALRCAKWFFVDDLHHRGQREARSNAALLCDTVLATYAYRFLEFFPEVERSRRIVWFPHSASPDFELAANEHPSNHLLLTGAITKTYPMRTRLCALMEGGLEGVVRLPHPGYHCDYDYESDSRVGPGFSGKIWECRAAFSDCSIHRYAVAKHFEIPATGALLAADAAIEGPLQELGFVPEVHYFPMRDEDLEDRVRYLLREENHPALDQIRRNGQALVLERHRTTHRAKMIDDLGRTEFSKLSRRQIDIGQYGCKSFGP